MEHCQPDDDNGGGSRREEKYHVFHRRISERCSRFCVTERRGSWYDATKGHLTRERFDGEAYASSYIDFSSDKLNATDLCSEFSAQCLLSSVANVVDGISIETLASNKLNPQNSPETSQLLGATLKCLIVARQSFEHLKWEEMVELK